MSYSLFEPASAPAPVGNPSHNVEITPKTCATSAERGEFEILFEKLGCAVLVFDDKLQLVTFNLAALDHIHPNVEDALRPGEALGCVHASEPPNGCGTTPSCAACVLRRTAETTLRTGKKSSTLAPLAVRKGCDVLQKTLLMTTAAVEFGHEKLVVITLQDVTALRQQLAPACMADIAPLS